MLTAFSIVAVLWTQAPDDAPPPGPDPQLGDGVAWEWSSFEEACAIAERDARPLFVYLWAPGSKHCSDSYASVVGDPGCLAMLQRYVCFAASAGEPRGTPLVEDYAISVVPTMFVMTSKGVVEDALVGTIRAPSFRVEMQRIESGRETVSDFRRRTEANPKDLSARLDLAAKLRHVGDLAAYEEVVATIREADPHGKTVVGAQLILREMMAEAAEAAGYDPAAVDLRDVARLLHRMKHKQVRFEGYDWLARRELDRGDQKAARRWFEEAADQLEPDQGTDWGAEVVMQYWGDRDGLSRRDLKFVADLGRRTADLALQYLQSQGGGSDGTPSGKPNVDVFVAEKVLCLACSSALEGKRNTAREVLELVETLDPENPDREELTAQILAHR